MKKLRIFPIIVPFLVIGLLSSCYPESAETNSDYDLILSAYNPEFNFDASTSFILPDTLVLLNDSTASDLIEITKEQQQAIINAVRDNLTVYGWTDSTDIGSNAETLVLVSAIVAKYTDNIWNEWNWYEGLGNIGRIGQNTRYPWFPDGFPYIYDYTIGTLLITMIDAEELKNDPEDVPVVWIGSLNGIVSSKTVNTSKLVQSIDKIFELSTPLHK